MTWITIIFSNDQLSTSRVRVILFSSEMNSDSEQTPTPCLNTEVGHTTTPRVNSESEHTSTQCLNSESILIPAPCLN